MLLLAMEMQDYTLGFAGINVLWNELNGFPRGVALLVGPMSYFYFRGQVNRNFRLRKKHLIHFAPYLFFFLNGIFFFAQGKEAVELHQASVYHEVLMHIFSVLMLASYIFYFTKCLSIYRGYRKWTMHQFSNTDLIAFSWFRNFVFAMIFWIACRQVTNILDAIYLWDFYQDWWWNLALVAVSFYIGLSGYAQKQTDRIYFDPSSSKPEDVEETKPVERQKEITLEAERTALTNKLQDIMDREKLYLQPDLTLQELARRLKTNTSLLSSTVNRQFEKNFNDYINALRIDEFISLHKADRSGQYTLVSLAMDSGFNSKATFQRAFKKHKGSTPKEYLSKLT